jgi:hypothetical protein
MPKAKTKGGDRLTEASIKLFFRFNPQKIKGV